VKLVFYSGGTDEENERLDEASISLCSSASPQLSYIPASSYGSESEFQDFVSSYKKFGVNRFLYFPIDIPFGDVKLEQVLDSDLIHLGGGNTYYFLNCLRKKKLIKKFKNFVKRGGVLTGLSAGGIIMTNDIMTASFPEFDRDDNDEGNKNLKSMGLVKFDFFPHYRNSKRYDEELLKYSKKNKKPLFACPDGSGVAIDGERMTFIGKSYCFFKGKKVQISSSLSKVA
jgi:dipeptidase E